MFRRFICVLLAAAFLSSPIVLASENIPDMQTFSESETAITSENTVSLALDAVTPIADVRNMEIGTPASIEGVVTKLIDGMLYVQDGTGGIALYSPGGYSASAGNTVAATGAVGISNGVVSLILSGGLSILSAGTESPAPAITDITSLNNGSFQGELISVRSVKIIALDSENLTVQGANGTVIQIYKYGSLPNGVALDSIINVTAIASRRISTVVLRVDSESDIELAVSGSSIYNEDDLKRIQNNLSGDYVLMNDIELNDNWVPISSFAGSFDGSGFTISGLNVLSNQEYNYTNAGLFGSIAATGSVRNLNVETRENSAVNAKIGATVYVGILAGVNRGVIDNCTTSGNVNGNYCSGGIVGYSYGTVLNSSSSATIRNSGENSGGLVGYQNGGRIEKSSFTGVVQGAVYTGGLVGRATGTTTISECVVGGTISGANGTGGFLGESTGTLSISNSNCYGDISGATYVGGYVGYADNSGSFSLSSSSFTGIVNGSGSYTGGLIGYLYRQATITGCYVNAKVIGKDYTGGLIGYESYYNYANTHSNNYVKGSIEGGSYVGGLYGTLSNSSAIVTRCYSNASVLGTNYLGGLVGAFGAGTMSNCYATGNVYGASSLGGVIGQLSGGTLNYCYATGKVLSTHFVSLNRSGIVGTYSSGTVNRCYFDMETTTCPISDYGLGKTTAQMKSVTTYLGWDFADVWNMSPGTNEGYPFLRTVYTDQTVVPAMLRTEADLELIRKNPSGSFELGNNIVLSKQWVPIERFEGFIDGNRYEIRNIEILFDNEHRTPEAGFINTLSHSGKVVNLGIVTSSYGLGGISSGGLVNANYGTIEDCYTKGLIKGEAFSGGLVGVNRGTVRRSYSTAKVEGKTNVGGLIGALYIEVYDSYVNAEVIGTDNVGGLIGSSYTTTRVSNCYALGKVRGVNNVGGLIGNSDTTETTVTSSITTIISTCYSSAVVNGVTSVGGLIGRSYTPYYSNYTRGITIRNCYVNGDVFGTAQVGGITGESNVQYASYNATIYTNCYAAGRVSGTSYTNGAIGRVTNGLSSVTACYYSFSLTGKTDSYFADKSITDLRTPATYADWDFSTVWDMNEGVNGNLPYLRYTPPIDLPETEYIDISTAAQLYAIRDDLNANYRLKNDITLTEMWFPLGSEAKPFYGVFDGNGCKITGLNVPQDEEYQFATAGLFGYVGGNATVKNLTVIAASSGVATTGPGKFAGGIAGQNFGLIDNCHYIGSVRATDAVGGIAGNNYGKIAKCTAAITINGTGKTGGIAGYSVGTIEFSNASGDVSSTGANTGGLVGENAYIVRSCYTENMTVRGTSSVGGIVGTGGSVDDCRSDSAVTATSNNAGGIAGQNAKILNSSATGNVTGTIAVGGIIGYINVATNTITDCFATGDIRASGNYAGGLVGQTTNAPVSGSHAIGNVTGALYVGGLIGHGAAAVSDCYAEGNVYASGNYSGGLIGQNTATVRSSHAKGDIVSEGSYVGGLIGMTSGAVSDSSALGSVSGNTSISDYAGGLIGRCESTLTRCYSGGTAGGRTYIGGLFGWTNSDVTYCYSTGGAMGKSYVGGLGGYVNAGNVTFSYATGRVYCDSNAGGLIGFAATAARIANSYYNSETSQMNDTGKGIPKSTIQMKNELTYIDWDYDNIWAIRTSINDGYPYLRSNAPVWETRRTVLIRTETDLRGIANDLRADYVLENDINLTGTFIPIGSLLNPFSGTLDGAGFTISGLTITDGGDNTGLFRVTGAGSKIFNLGLETERRVSGQIAVGALVGQNRGYIEVCCVNATVEGEQRVGGFIGINYGVVESSSSKGNVSATNGAGGLVGQNFWNIKNSYSESAVTGVTNTGGLAGTSDGGLIDGSYAIGNVTASTSACQYAGGLVGRLISGTINGCYASNAVSGYQYTGGIAGYADAGTVSSTSAVSAVTGYQYIGGFIGNNYANISNCYAQGSRVTSTGTYVGGFIGRHLNGSVSNCYAAVPVSSTASNNGAFFGSVSGGTYANNFFDSDLYPRNDGGQATGKTTVEMGQISTFTGWNFTTIWTLDTAVSKYPYLKWQPGPTVPPSVIPTISITITAPTTTVALGESLALGYTLYPSNATDPVTWISANTNVVQVNARGIVTAISEGVTVVTAISGKAQTQVTITVTTQLKSGNIVSVKPIPDIHLPYGSTLADAMDVLPRVCEVTLSTMSLMTLFVDPWRPTEGTTYDFTGTIIIPLDSITNTNNITVSAKVIIDPEVIPSRNIKSVTQTEISVKNGTSVTSVMSMLPQNVQVTLEDDAVVELTAAWSNVSNPPYNGFTEGKYIFTAAIALPGDGSVKNPTDVRALAQVTVVPPEQESRSIISFVAVENINVPYNTEFSTARELLPQEIYVVLDNQQAISVKVTWGGFTSPDYNPRMAGIYTIYGTVSLPEYVSNPLNLRPSVNIVVKPSDQAVKSLTVIGKTAIIGSITDVTIEIDPNTEMAMGSFTLAFDNSKLTPIGYEVGGAVNSVAAMVNMNYQDPDTKARQVKISWMGTNALNEGGTVLTIRFLVHEDNVSNTYIPLILGNLVLQDIRGNAIPCNMINGSIHAVFLVLGDVNGDGKVDISDAFMILLSDAGLVTLTEQQLLAADVNSDGYVDILDAMIIQRYDIGLIDSLE